jgi:signal transduction histidine kinase/CheY-like chemotaxis protein
MPMLAGRMAVAASFGILVAFTLGSQSRQPGESPGTSALFAAAFLPIYWLASVLAWRASHTTALDATGRRAWQLIALANAVLATNNIVFYVSRRLAPFPGDEALIALVLPALWYTAIFSALARLPRRLTISLERATFWLDAATVLVSGLLILMYVFGHTPGESSFASPVAAITTIGVPALNAVVIFAAVIVILRPAHGVSRHAIGLLATSVAVTVVADLAYSRAAAIGAHRPGVWYEPLYLLAACFAAASAQMQRERPGSGSEWAIDFGSIRSSILPYAAVIGAVSVVVLEIQDRWDTPLGRMVLGAVLLTALVMARQLISRRHVAMLAAAEQARLTKQASLELQLQQAQKLEAVGMLAGGIAHDFNNILMAIRGTAELAADPGADIKQDLREITRAVDHGASLTRQLLAFGRRDAVQLKRFDLRGLVGDMEEMLRRLMPRHIALRVTQAPDDVPVELDRGQIEQVLLNLAINARDAMPSGGTLGITVGSTTIDAAQGVIPEGRYATLVVSDTGLGMAPEVRARMFEPFYTTKPRGRGSGLGLSTVYSIVSRAGGTINVQSSVGEGSTFEILLPLADVFPVVEGGVEATDTAALASPTGEVVMIVDDESALRELVGKYLSRHGYRVIVAANAADALAGLSSREERVDLLLTDISMPGMSGLELIDRARALKPDMRVICMSGYAEPETMTVPEANYLKKPFGLATLGRLVRSTLETGPV